MFRMNSKKSSLDDEIESVVEQMALLSADTENYTTMAKNLEVLMNAKAKQASTGVSKDTAVTVGANLAGIVLVLGYEKANVIASKAFGLISKLHI